MRAVMVAAWRRSVSVVVVEAGWSWLGRAVKKTLDADVRNHELYLRA